MRSIAVGTLLFATLWAVPVHAQTGGRFAIGAESGSRIPAYSSAGWGKAGGITWRIGHSREGWGWRYGLGWYSTDLTRDVGELTTKMGELKIRPLMGGYGYTHIIGRAALSANLVAGYTFASLSQHIDFNEAYRNRLGVQSVQADVGNTFAVRPGVSLWYDLNEKIGLNINGTYTVARPRLTLRSPLGAEQERLRADMFAIKIGFVYSIF